MSRYGITLDQVRRAITAIESRSEKVTAERVRNELGGTGSYSTITAHLKTLATEEVQQSVSVSDLPKDLAESVASNARQMWQLASSLANSDVEIIRRTSSKTNEMLSEQLQCAIETMEKIEDELDISKSRVVECDLEIEKLRNSNSAYKARLAIRNKEDDSITKNMKDLIYELTNLVCEQGRILEGKNLAVK